MRTIPEDLEDIDKKKNTEMENKRDTIRTRVFDALKIKEEVASTVPSEIKGELWKKKYILIEQFLSYFGGVTKEEHLYFSRTKKSQKESSEIMAWKKVMELVPIIEKSSPTYYAKDGRILDIKDLEDGTYELNGKKYCTQEFFIRKSIDRYPDIPARSIFRLIKENVETKEKYGGNDIVSVKIHDYSLKKRKSSSFSIMSLDFLDSELFPVPIKGNVGNFFYKNDEWISHNEILNRFGRYAQSDLIGKIQRESPNKVIQDYLKNPNQNLYMADTFSSLITSEQIEDFQEIGEDANGEIIYKDNKTGEIWGEQNGSFISEWHYIQESIRQLVADLQKRKQDIVYNIDQLSVYQKWAKFYEEELMKIFTPIDINKVFLAIEKIKKERGYQGDDYWTKSFDDIIKKYMGDASLYFIQKTIGFNKDKNQVIYESIRRNKINDYVRFFTYTQQFSMNRGDFYSNLQDIFNKKQIEENRSLKTPDKDFFTHSVNQEKIQNLFAAKEKDESLKLVFRNVLGKKYISEKYALAHADGLSKKIDQARKSIPFSGFIWHENAWYIKNIDAEFGHLNEFTLQNLISKQSEQWKKDNTFTTNNSTHYKYTEILQILKKEGYIIVSSESEPIHSEMYFGGEHYVLSKSVLDGTIRFDDTLKMGKNRIKSIIDSASTEDRKAFEVKIFDFTKKLFYTFFHFDTLVEFVSKNDFEKKFGN